MDNAKAIDLLDNLIGMIDDNQNNDYDAAFRMAIDTLKTQLYREDATSDLISRQAAIDALDCINGVEEVLRALPSAQPERKTGRWMFGFNNQYLEKYYYCSNCGCRKYTEDEPSDYFCSNCGADMRGGDAE